MYFCVLTRQPHRRGVVMRPAWGSDWVSVASVGAVGCAVSTPACISSYRHIRSSKRSAPRIKGRFKGQIKGGAVQLHATARVVGDITYDSLSIESGAQVEGACIPRAAPRIPAPTDQAKGSAVE